ncbi:MAG: hypothetical protein HXY25_10340 [Alphaproteobacteria bacterium]|nr:hypothetical protein [Alphaproteobacteria bacterium]
MAERLSRRQGLGLIGGGLCAASLPARAASADPARFMTGAALYDHVRTYTGLGEHRTGTPGDLATADWIAEVFSRAGLETEKQPVPFRYWELGECFLEVGGTRFRTDPEFFPLGTSPEGITAPLRMLTDGEPLEALAGSIWLVETTRVSMVVPRALREQAVEAGRKGALGVVIIVASWTGDLLGRGAIPPAGDTDWQSVPIVGAAPKDGDVLKAAAASGTPVRLVSTGRDVPNHTAYNVIGRWQGTREPERLVIVTTPQSGMFRCGGERGGGIAQCLGLAEWVAARRPGISYLFSTNTGHEQKGRGAGRLHQEIVPPPEKVEAWLHLGSGIGSYDWRAAADGSLERHVGSPGAIRNFGAVPSLVPLLTKAFDHIPGLVPQSERFEGELGYYVGEGYPGFGFWGANAFHHTLADGPEQTGPELQEPIGLALRKALLAIEAG